MNSLIERIPDLLERNRNFAYICRFENEERINGREMLFTGDKIVESDSSALLDDLKEETPVIVSFTYARHLFHLEKRKSAYPGIVALVPDQKFENVIKREAPMSGSRVKGVFVDKKLEEDIKEVVGRIMDGEVLQVVLSRTFGPLFPDPVERLKEFIRNDRSIYVFYYKFGDYEILGSSPENVVTVNGRNIMIEPIAGTRKFSSDSAERELIKKSLLEDEKELLEHRMLVDLARNDLGKISEYGSVRVTSSMIVREFNSVMHIVSRVESVGRKDLKMSQVLDSVFPAGTVSGAPKERAMEIIDRYEGDDRGPYSGAVGLVSKDQMDLALSIRCIYRIGGNFYARAGAGIVKDSVPQNEVQEMFNKALSATGGDINEVALCK
ncbi:chorismate-binding protein [Cuniculiplasma sp. SKW4]|uniref:chorismate-binding protein n=1 Tax=Cuniculiplasma sp. SKW4 TaxID=3400171 RepID=UPI003FD1FB5D